MTDKDPSPQSRRAAAWQARRINLEIWLKDEPQSRQAWEWRLHLKILNFLLSRYGNRPLIDNEPGSQSLWPVPDVKIADHPKPLTTPSQMRRVLTKASAVNYDPKRKKFTEEDCYPPSCNPRLARDFDKENQPVGLKVETVQKMVMIFFSINLCIVIGLFVSFLYYFLFFVPRYH